jgi:imidazolonepropionase-like amidohydrolase
MIVLPRASLIYAMLLLTSCGPPPGSRGVAILGALLIDGAGGPPLSNSIVVVADSQIRAAGRRSAIPIPSEADKIDGSGKSLLPTPLDACPGPGAIRPTSADDARRQVAAAAGIVYLAEAPPEISEAALETARSANVLVLPHISTLAQARLLVERGATGFVGMIVDTEDLDPAFLSHLRDLKVVFAPALVAAGSNLETAKRNTKRLFDAGVPIAAAGKGGDIFRELELLVEAGLPPLDAIVAGTRNSAALLRRSDLFGSIAPGKRADLLLVEGNAGEDIRHLRKVVLTLSAGSLTSR